MHRVLWLSRLLPLFLAGALPVSSGCSDSRVAAVPAVSQLVTSSASTPKSCTKGIPCGNTCINGDKVCHIAPTSSGSTSTTPPRDEYGRFIRSSSAKARFMRETGYPKGRPGYVVDHIIPLACGGADDPSNMQWQTKEAAEEKDGWERKGC